MKPRKLTRLQKVRRAKKQFIVICNISEQNRKVKTVREFLMHARLRIKIGKIYSHQMIPQGE